MNSNELRAQMARHGDNNNALAKALGKTVASVCNKIKGRRPFSLSEVQTIITRYDLTAEQTVTIFFAPKVAENETNS